MFETVGREAPVHRRRRAGALVMSTMMLVGLCSAAALSSRQLVLDEGDELAVVLSWVEPALPPLAAPPRGGGSAAPDEAPPPEGEPPAPEALEPEPTPDDGAAEPREPEDAPVVASLAPGDAGPGDGLGGSGVGSGGGSGPGAGPGDCQGADCGDGAAGGAAHWSELSFRVQTKPRFPEDAKRMGMERADCLVKVYFDVEGRHYRHAIESCHPAFHNEISRAVQRWRIRPYRVNGEPSPTVAVIPISFRLR